MKEIFKSDIEKVMLKAPVLTKDQLERYLIVACSADPTEAQSAIKEACVAGLILQAPNGLVTTHKAVNIVTDGAVEYNNDKAIAEMRLRNDILLPIRLKQFVECFYVVLDLLPDSIEFYMGPDPFTLSFVDYESNRLVQVAYFQKGGEILKSIEIKEHPQPAEEERPMYKRIAVLEDASGAKDVAKLGFTHLCVVDHKECAIELVEKVNTDEVWADVRA